MDAENNTRAAAEPNSAPGKKPRYSVWVELSYFLLVPLVIAVYAGLNNWQMQQTAGIWASVVFYLGHSLLPWWITCGLTTATKFSLQQWKPPWVLILLLGHTLGCLVVLPYSNWFTSIYQERWPDLQFMGDESHLPLLSAEFWMYWVRAGVIWLGVNFIFDRYLGLPLYRYVLPRGYDSATTVKYETQPEGWGEHRPGFVDRLPIELTPSEMLAIKAEQHYIRIYSPHKEYMVLYRFSDAIRELDEQLGQQVHRSYWVSTNAIESINTKAKDFRIRISTGIDIPVSGPYQGLIREIARRERLTTRG